ncbi:MAG: ATP-binding cassette protein, partial [Paucimonas sp.]|nr:ATP-binding cassette protein [Paucimonas sp.]
MNQTAAHARQPFVLEGVTKHFGSQLVLDNLSWQTAPGKVIGLLGRNGAGKSTLLECMLGLREVDAGAIKLFGDSPEALSDETRARIGYVPQNSDLFEWMTPLQMLAYFKAFYPRWNDAKVNALLDRWCEPLSRNKRIANLSGGEKQRLSIIRALGHDPELLLLDEPVASLDPAGRRDFLRELIERGIERETTVIFSTHIMSDLERVALDVAFMKSGRIVIQQSLDNLLDKARRITGPSATLAEMRFKGEISR